MYAPKGDHLNALGFLLVSVDDPVAERDTQRIIKWQDIRLLIRYHENRRQDRRGLNYLHHAARKKLKGYIGAWS